MAKRTNATKAQSGAERAAPGQHGAAQRELPGLTAGESMPAPITIPSAPRDGRRATPTSRLLLASPSGSNQQPRARQQPASQPTPVSSPAPASQSAHAAPKRPRPSGARALSELREALAEGWEIIQPIFARPLWSAADDSRMAYNFVLRRDQATRLLTAPGTVAIERFIETHRFTVDHRS